MCNRGGTEPRLEVSKVKARARSSLKSQSSESFFAGSNRLEGAQMGLNYFWKNFRFNFLLLFQTCYCYYAFGIQIIAEKTEF